MYIKLIPYLILIGLSSIEPQNQNYLSNVITDIWNRYQGPNIADPIYDEVEETYDFVIVGAGSSGCALASRLSEITKWKILLLEAGLPESPLGKIPAVSLLLQTTRYGWHYKTVPQKSGCFGMINNMCSMATGKGLGGGSAINNNIYTVGNRFDYNEWSEAGNPGWSYEEILPYIKKLENVHLRDYDKDYHGTNGPVNVELQRNPSVIRLPFLEALRESNYSILDYNGRNQIGFNDVQVTTFNGRKNSIAAAYLNKIKNRKNLIIKTGSFVEKLLIGDDLQALGVVYKRNGRRLIAKARNEVILSAGAINSPKILQLSGIGPREYLNSIGIKSIVDLPVGDNLRDHVTFMGMQFVYQGKQSNQNYINSFSDWIIRGDGPLTSCAADVLGYVNAGTSDNPDQADLEIVLSPYTVNYDFRIANAVANFNRATYDSFFKPTENLNAFTLLIILSRPRSSGTVRIRSDDPRQDPLIDPKYLTHPEDVEVILRGVRTVLGLSRTDAFKKINATLVGNAVYGCERFRFPADDYWRCAVRRLHVSSFHPSGTTKMGPEGDPGAVVDSRLRVRGTDRLRVVDVGVVPNRHSAHTMIPAVMIAEKGADLIKEDWGEYTELNVE